MKNDDRPVLIIASGANQDPSDLYEPGNSGLLISSLLTIHKTLTRFALDWEISTFNGFKVLLTNDVNNEESQNFYSNFMGKINAPRSLEDLRAEDYRGFIIPSVKAFLGSFKTSPLVGLFAGPVLNLMNSCKNGIISGYGLVCTFECKKEGKWVLDGFNVASVSLVQQSIDERFANFNYLIEDKVRELGGNFVWNDRSQELVVLDKGIITVQDDNSLAIGCNLFGYVLTENS
jgi:hypothetical protein